MPVAVLAVLQWLHVLLGIFWFGTVLYADFILVPVIQGLKPATQLEVADPIGRRTLQIIVPVAIAVIVLGVARGIANGALAELGSAYGLTWIASFVLGCVTLAWGVWIVAPAINAITRMEAGPTFTLALARVRALAFAELGLFLLILCLMVALRFGY